jgi:hypothetical protein
MATPLSPPQHQNPRRDRQQELAALNDQFDLATGKKSKPTPWHKEPKLSKGKQKALDQQEPQQRKSGGFYKETTEQKTQQEAFDLAMKNVKAPGTGTWKATPPTKKEKLLAWHKSLGSPAHVVEQELKALEEQEGKA